MSRSKLIAKLQKRADVNEAFDLVHQLHQQEYDKQKAMDEADVESNFAYSKRLNRPRSPLEQTWRKQQFKLPLGDRARTGALRRYAMTRFAQNIKNPYDILGNMEKLSKK